MKKINNFSIFLLIFTLFSCQKNDTTLTENAEKVDSTSLKEIQENQVKEILFAKKIVFERIYVSKDEFDNNHYYSGFKQDGKFDEAKGIFTEITIPENGNLKINQKFIFNSGILELDRIKSYGYELQKDRTYNFELDLRDYGILAIDKSVKSTKGETYCGMLIYNTTDYDTYLSDSYVEAIKNDFKQLNGIK